MAMGFLWNFPKLGRKVKDNLQVRMQAMFWSRNNQTNFTVLFYYHVTIFMTLNLPFKIFQVYRSVALNTFTLLCKCNNHLSLGLFIFPNWNSVSIKQSFPIPTTAILVLGNLQICLFVTFHIDEIIQYMVLFGPLSSGTCWVVSTFWLWWLWLLGT